MEDNHTPYHMPDDFNPHIALDAIRGLSAAIHQFMTEGPGTVARIPDGELSGFVALVELLDEQVRDFHAWFRDIENRTTLRLPMCEEDFERMHVKHHRNDGVSEPRALYAVS